MKRFFGNLRQRFSGALWVFRHYNECRIKDDSQIKYIMSQDVLCSLDLWNQEHNDVLGESATMLLKQNSRYNKRLTTKETRYLYYVTLRAVKDLGFRHVAFMLTI